MSTMNNEFSKIRKDFSKFNINLKELDSSPIKQIEKWVDDAVEAKQAEPTAMSLSTVDEDLMPYTRVVLLKGVDSGLIFYTNYQSSKGKQIEFSNKVSLQFFWPELERQIHINGVVEMVEENLSDNYFNSRPRDSQIGAWASSQSEEIESFEDIETRFNDFAKKFEGKNVPRPKHWGGYRVMPTQIEFWQGRPNRLHQRVKYVKNGTQWEIMLLSP